VSLAGAVVAGRCAGSGFAFGSGAGVSAPIVATLAGAGAVVGGECWQAAAATDAANAAHKLKRVT